MPPPNICLSQDRVCPFLSVLADHRRSRDLAPGTHVPHIWHAFTLRLTGRRTPELRKSDGLLNSIVLKICNFGVFCMFYDTCIIKRKCSSNMLKNSQRAARVGLLCFPELCKGQKAQKEWHSLGPKRQRGRALISCLLLAEVRERNFFHGIQKATSGEGGDRPTGQRERCWRFRCSPSWKIVLFSAPFRSFRQAQVTGQLWKCSFEAKHSLLSAFPQDKAEAIMDFYEPSSIKHAFLF